MYGKNWTIPIQLLLLKIFFIKIFIYSCAYVFLQKKKILNKLSFFFSMLLIDDECLLERIVFRANTKRDKAKSFLSKNKNIDTHCIINIIKGLIFFLPFLATSLSPGWWWKKAQRPEYKINTNTCSRLEISINSSQLASAFESGGRRHTSNQGDDEGQQGELSDEGIWLPLFHWGRNNLCVTDCPPTAPDVIH